jgi:hypothetical protein
VEFGTLVNARSISSLRGREAQNFLQISGGAMLLTSPDSPEADIVEQSVDLKQAQRQAGVNPGSMP